MRQGICYVGSISSLGNPPAQTKCSCWSKEVSGCEAICLSGKTRGVCIVHVPTHMYVCICVHTSAYVCVCTCVSVCVHVCGCGTGEGGLGLKSLLAWVSHSLLSFVLPFFPPFKKTN